MTAVSSQPAKPGALSNTLFCAWLALIVCLAAALRAYDINSQPFWMDEAFTYFAARNPVETIIWGGIDNHPPLFYLVQHFWQSAFPEPAFMRVPAIVFGIATVCATALAGADLLGKRQGLIAAAIVALSSSQIYFSLDTRMYSLLALGSMLGTWGLLGALRRPSIGYFALYVAGAVIAIYSHMIALVYLFALNIIVASLLLFQKRLTDVFAKLLGANLVLLALVLPAFILISSAAGTFPGLGKTSLLAIPWFVKNTLGFPAIPGIIGLSLFGLSSLFLAFSAFKLLQDRRDTALALVLSNGLFFILLVVIDQAYLSILENRILLVMVAPLALVFAAGFCALQPAKVQAIALAVMVAVGTWSAVELRRLAPKIEDVPRAMAIAQDRGFGNAPLATCDLFTSLTASLYSDDRPVLWIANKKPVLAFNPNAVGAIPISEFRQTSRPDLMPKLQAKGLGEDGTQTLVNSEKVVAIEALCNIDKRMQREGFQLIEKKALDDRPAVMESVWTRVSLWQRPADKNRAQEPTN